MQSKTFVNSERLTEKQLIKVEAVAYKKEVAYSFAAKNISYENYQGFSKIQDG